MSVLYRSGFILLVLLSTCLQVSCNRAGMPIELATFTESKVSVEISLDVDENDQAWLIATFTPEAGKHLYSKDIPRDGVDGLGRPTLLEVVPGSRIKAAGKLSESVAAFLNDEMQGLPTYPEGPVTLSLPISLPEGTGWFDEQVSITYMACSAGACYPPVVEKLVPVRLPGEEELNP